ncbi:MAG: type II secretion system protein, partial [Candidatus Moraniibacteriota bacterium]
MNQKKSGFTLIEMLIVIAIIGILSAVVIFAISGTRQKAAATRAIADMTSLKQAAEMASVEGCTSYQIDTLGGSSVLACTAPAAKNYATYAAPAGATYVIDLDTTVAGTTTTATSTSQPFSFTAQGFSNNTATYTCVPSGCYCSSVGLCAT